MIGGNARQAAAPEGRGRDPRLDFFRGAAMLIILTAHIPMNAWALWIPARFGFSDATEIFVFCSGFASALAFGATYLRRGWAMGTTRIVHRVWQVYWAHVGVFVATVAMLAAIDLNGWGARPHAYVTEPYVLPLLDEARRTLPALLTLRYVPGLFDILPMYLVILAMIPAVMALHRAGGAVAVAAAVWMLWLAATLGALWWRLSGDAGDAAVWTALAPLGANFAALNLPATPDGSHVWFFNPFAWQLVFFAGFAFGAGWLPAPPRSRRLALLSAAVIALSLPLAWHKLYLGHYLPEGSGLAAFLSASREAMWPLWDKTAFGILRCAHFLALAYLAWWAAGPSGARLSQGLPAPAGPAPARGRRMGIAAATLLVTAPYAHATALQAMAPGLMAALPLAPGPGTDALSLVHLAALAALLWHAAPDGARVWLRRDAVVAVAPVLRKVGTQSLAVFMASIPLSQLCGLALDHLGRGPLSVALVNLGGMAALIGVAYGVAWLKTSPWRGQGIAARGAPVLETGQGAR